MNEDGALVERVLHGDRSAYGQLMAHHKGWLYRFIRRQTATAEDAEDIVQETFASAWRALPRYDPERPFDIWLRRIALNKCRDLGRKQTLRRTVFMITHPFADAEERVPVLAPAADTAMIAAESLGKLQAAIARLPANLREPLVLTALEGMSQKEAAEILHTNVKAIENRVARARAKLAVMLDAGQVQDVSEVRRESGG